MKVYIDAYLAKNLGDDLFVDILTKRYPNHSFTAISKIKYKYYSKNLRIISNQYLYRAVKKLQLEKYIANKCDAVVSIGGSIYMENNDSKRDFSLGKNKRYILGTNFGPYKTEEYYNNLHEVFKNAEDVCFREKYSYELFRDLPNVRYAPDIVFSLDTESVRNTNRRRAIISIISCKHKLDDNYTIQYEEIIIELIKFLFQNNYEICLMSFCKAEADEEAIESIIEKCDDNMKNKIEKYYYNGNIKEALDIIGDSQIVFGSRFHANVLGLILGKTIIPIIYSDKTVHLLEDLNIDAKYIDIRQINDFDVNSISQQDLNKKYDVQEQKEKAENHFKLLDELLERKTNE